MFKRCIFSNCLAKICFICIVERLNWCRASIPNYFSHTLNVPIVYYQTIPTDAPFILLTPFHAPAVPFSLFLLVPLILHQQTIHFLNFLLGFRLLLCSRSLPFVASSHSVVYIFNCSMLWYKRIILWIKHQVCCAIIFVWFLMRSGEWVQYTQASEDFIYVIWMGTTQFSLGKFSFALRLSFLSPICIEPHVYQTQLQVHFNVHQRWWCTHFSGYQRGSIRLHRCACVWFALDS